MQAGTSSSDTNDKGQRPVKLKYLFVVDVPDVFTDSFHGNCHDLIGHDLRRLGQAVLGCGFHKYPKEGSIGDRSCERTYDNTRELLLVQSVRLDNHSRARLSEFSWSGN